MSVSLSVSLQLPTELVRQLTARAAMYDLPVEDYIAVVLERWLHRTYI